ncbi:competence type IV pilus assembly protein ComGB [Halalkalibacter alkalisediminis]|uniref:Competence type IV pilus assembly protein ComGB n=1 Tax=Halalkalibacter alkalisediminis TaxID=935616 RepID=A0ABV6NNA0_9BACI|nr:competence type IV pilus assembly protein ComGB [Halalkalibacter alkalisediminis]
MMYFKRRAHNSKHLRTVATSFIRIGRLLEQGYPIEMALRFIQFHVSSNINEQIEQVLIQLKDGHPVHEAFQSFDIPNSIKSFLFFYEQQGQLAQGFTQAGMLLNHREKVMNELTKLLRYPLTLIFLCGLVIVLMFQFVFPHFRSFFTMLSESPPLFTKMFMQLLYLIPYLIMASVIMLLLSTLYILIKMKKWSVKKKIMKLMNIPFCKNHVQNIISYFFSLQLGKLLIAGMTLQEALLQFEKQEYLPFFQQECYQISCELQQGRPFNEILKEKVYFCKELSFVVDNGEKTGYLAVDLQHYSDILFQELENSLQKGLRLVQPILFIIIGGFIFLLFIATLLPMFQMIGAI